MSTVNPPPSPGWGRRHFLQASLLAAGASALLGRKSRGGPGPENMVGAGIRREIFIPSPHAGASVVAASYYTRPQGLDLISIAEIMQRSDTVEAADFRYSPDNGRTWAAGEEFPTVGVRPGGRLRRAMRAALADPVTGRLLQFYMEGILPSDDPLEGFRQWVTYYRASEDGGRTWYVNEQIIQQGPEFNADHPIAGVRRHHTGFMIGDIASRPIFLADGTLLVPVLIAPAGPDGNYFNAGGGYTYTDGAVLRGRWGPDGRHLQWERSELIKIDPNLSTRGADEPTLEVLADGRLLMLIRGSNDKKPHLPGRRWMAYSSDQGRTWTKPVPWTYTDGSAFFSPAASSQLLAHSSGRLFWLGNISPTNTTGNRPRYPFIIGEVDRRTGLLERQRVRVVDDKAPHESTLLALSSPSSREDRETGEIVVNMTRWGANSAGNGRNDYNWTANAYLYRIPVA